MKLSLDQSLAGILVPVFAIRTETDLGIGDTDGVRQMIDWCHKYGLNIFQTLPINETGPDNSPYNAISSMAIDPATIAVLPSALPDLTQAHINQNLRSGPLWRLRGGNIEYAKARAVKRTLLEVAFESFLTWPADPERASQFHQFQADHKGWLEDYALFRVLMEENGNQPAWERWLPAHQTPDRARDWLLSLPHRHLENCQRKQIFFMYVQWLAFQQWQALKRYGESKQVCLMGDIPYGVARNSADVWANRDLFDLDWSGGAPPEKFFKTDPFTEKWGQNWGVPNYRWDEFRRRDFAWWRTRFGNIRKIFHFCRIDHAPGFFRIYSFPWTPDRNGEFLPLDEKKAAERTAGRLPGFKPFPDDTVEHKEFNQQQGEEIFRVMLEASGDTVIVAEDLGVVPDYLPPTLHRLGIPGFRIPSFYRAADGRYADPAGYPRLSLAQPATHDHPSLAATWREHWRNIAARRNVAAHRHEMRRLMEFAGINRKNPPRWFNAELRGAYLRTLLHSNSWLVVVMITDVFGQRLRFNTPGTCSKDNWTVRLPQTVREMNQNPVFLTRAKTYARLARESGRGMPR